MNDTYTPILRLCQQHADRLRWSMQALQSQFPLSAEKLTQLTDTEQAILDQFSTRFSKLQDAMGAKLFPIVLELVKESGALNTFIDKLHRLEKIGAVSSSEDWLALREMRNQFAHDYPDEPELRAAFLNKAFLSAKRLLDALEQIRCFAAQYQTD